MTRALATDARARYPSARELAADIASFLDGQLVGAYAYSPADHLRRFVKAYRVPLGVVTAALLALIVVAVAAYTRVVDERNRAVRAEGTATEALTTADRHLARSLVEQSLVALRSGALAEAEVLAAHALTLEERPEARGVLGTVAAATRPTRTHHAVRPGGCNRTALDAHGTALLCFEEKATSYWSLTPGDSTFVWRQPIRALGGAVLPTSATVILQAVTDETIVTRRSDGHELARRPSLLPVPSYLASDRDAWQNGGSRLFEIDGTTGVHELTEPCGPKGIVLASAVSGDATRLAVGCAGSTLGIHDRGGAVGPLTPNGLGIDVTTLAWSPDGKYLSLGSPKGDVAIWDIGGASLLRRTTSIAGPVRRMQFSPDGALLLVESDRGGPVIWDPRGGAWVARLPTSVDRGARWQSTGRTIMTLGRDISWWSLPNDLRVQRIDSAVGEGLTTAVPSPDGRTIATAAGAGNLRVHDSQSGALLAHHQLKDGVIKRVAFTPDGTQLISVSVVDNDITRLDTRTWGFLPPMKGGPARRVLALNDGVIPLLDGPTYNWVPFGSSTREPLTNKSPTRYFDLGVSPNATHAILLRESPRAVHPLDLTTRPPTVGHGWPDERAEAIDVSSDGLRAAVAHPNEVVLRDARTGAEQARLTSPDAELLDVAWSPDDTLVAAAGRDGSARVWRVTDRTLLAVFHGHDQRAPHVEFSPDGETIITASWDGTVRRWALPPLTRPAAGLRAEAEQRWGMGLEDALLSGRR